MSEPRWITEAEVFGLGSEIKVAEVTLTNAQIITLPTVPVVIVPAPGIGNIVSFITAVVLLDTSAGVYTNGPTGTDSGMAFSTGVFDVSTYGLQGNYGLQAKGIQVFGQFVQWNSDLGLAPSLILGSLSDFENKSIEIYISSTNGNLTGGNTANTMKVIVCYLPIKL